MQPPEPAVSPPGAVSMGATENATGLGGLGSRAWGRGFEPGRGRKTCGPPTSRGGGGVGDGVGCRRGNTPNLHVKLFEPFDTRMTTGNAEQEGLSGE
eukprot:CAMPEP_0174379426 /NCGR_PEP_ID=MMETSP0811_2-20130205/122704_1 /TAXON_ID=73025 ORGANISM="Eutreptiella gymnastica-like, Strain CCMP1594" /NCGR_SAMPLE_ID=MMETSP0811_2 /ASSEMBLY_ACC=CAM_ASM_000667 /LENGTH=96 /DNA_ID=CAMNT_0015531965 /DNA_START=80 /DNA_END=370 /DNA_ORIENTATION=+